jgi:multimeric flavodoxin WrbA
MAHILGIVGSPRRNGNTHLLVSRLLEGAESNGDTSETVFLNDLRIRECDGCHACWAGRPCSKNDDMNPLYDRIAACDAIIFGTPVYWYGPTAIMKAFIDRLVYFGCPENRPKIKGKPGVIVVPFEEETPETAALLVEFFEKSLRYLEMPLAAQLLVPGVTRKGEVTERPESLDRAFDLGRQIPHS